MDAPNRHWRLPHSLKLQKDEGARLFTQCAVRGIETTAGKVFCGRHGAWCHCVQCRRSCGRRLVATVSAATSVSTFRS
jgi:hypothetical protein